MPFTFSHPAAILPLVRAPLPAAGLAIGAMAPDLVFFVPFGPSRELSHSLAGAVTLDPVIAVAGLVLWWALLRAPVLDLGPRGIRERMRPRAGTPSGGPVRVALLVLAAVLVGIATHLAWDWLTHRDGLASVWTPWSVRVGPLPLTSWLQYLSSAAGAGILLLWGRRWWMRTDPDASRIRRAPDAAARIAVGALVVLALAAAVVAGAASLAGGLPGGLPGLVFRVVVTPIAVDLAAVVVIAIAWWVVLRGRRSGDRGQPASRIRS